MAKQTETKERTPAAPKVGTCQCSCDGATKGGNFLPGHDARLVSRLVNEVIGKSLTENQARVTMKPFSDALKAKFDKSLRLSKEKAQKSADAAKAKADAKAQAQKDKAAKAAKAAEPEPAKA